MLQHFAPDAPNAAWVNDEGTIRPVLLLEGEKKGLCKVQYRTGITEMVWADNVYRTLREATMYA